MQLGMIGLGRMGANMARRLMAAGIECVVYDRDAAAVASLQKEGAIGAKDLVDLVGKLEGPRHIWMMIPAAFVDSLIEELQYDFDLAEVTEVWRRGSVIGSWLLDLSANALNKDPVLDNFSGQVSDSGEGRWTNIAAIEAGVPVHVLSAALFERFNSRGEADFANQILSALRYEFGGHHEKQEQ